MDCEAFAERRACMVTPDNECIAVAESNLAYGIPR